MDPISLGEAITQAQLLLFYQTDHYIYHYTLALYHINMYICSHVFILFYTSCTLYCQGMLCGQPCDVLLRGVSECGCAEASHLVGNHVVSCYEVWGVDALRPVT